jgi:phosphatidylserine decarboxylase
MAKSLAEWVATDVRRARRLKLRKLSERHFFRDPVRASYSNTDLFFSPADGVILYQRIVRPKDPVIEIKGRDYTLADVLRDPDYAETALVIGIFMTAYDVHINRMPYSGRLSFRELPPIGSRNRPMLDIEDELLRRTQVSHDAAGYVFSNQRMLNRVQVPGLGLSYFIVQIADFDVATITPFHLQQNTHVFQNQRFSQIRFGSQVDLVVPLRPGTALETLQPDGWHVEAGIDPLIRLQPAH